MEKACELCLVLRPVVYCKADSAHLCLPCDATVHSANPIVGCHHRTILCDSCKYRSVDIECSDHLMFMCRVCDASLHRKCSPHGQHRKRTLASSFTGCPSAKDFAAFWGFKLDESDGVGSNSQRFKKVEIRRYLVVMVMEVTIRKEVLAIVLFWTRFLT